MAKKQTKGKRYSADEKQKVLDYVEKIDSEKGRGGVAAAAREFGITPLTITAWKKKGGSSTSSASVSKAAKGSSSQSRVLHRLAQILDAIDAKKAEVTALEKEYAKLKKKI